MKKYELKEKLYSALRSKAEINDLSEKLLTKYLEQEKELQQSFFSLHSKKENSDLSQEGKVKLCEEADGIYYFKLASLPSCNSCSKPESR